MNELRHGPCDGDGMNTTLTVPDVEPAPEAAPAPAPKKRSVKSARPAKPRSMRRENRWKRRGVSVQNRRFGSYAAFAFIAVAVFVILELSTKTVDTGPEGPLAKIVFEAFPEADPKRIEIVEENGLPSRVVMHLPSHMVEPSRGWSDPFALLGAEFGRAERTLSGVEMGKRIKQVSDALLPEGTVRCHTYDVGGISSTLEDPRRTRALFLHLNPGC